MLDSLVAEEGRHGLICFCSPRRRCAGSSRIFRLSHGIARVDDRRVISGIIFVIRNGLRWRDAPREYGPHKTIYNRFVRWSRLGVFNKIFRRTGAQGRQARPADDRRDASESASHRRQPFKKGSVPRRIGRTKGGLNSKLHAVCDGQGRRSSCCSAKAR